MTQPSSSPSSRGRRPSVLARGVAAAALLVSLGVCAAAVSRVFGRGTLAPGDPMPAIEIRAGSDMQRLGPGHGGTVVVMFSDDRCDHCHYQLDVFEKLLPQMGDVRVYVVRLDRRNAASGSAAALDRRARWPRLASAPSVTWGFVDRGAWRSTFGTLLAPSLYVFRDGTLAASYLGETSASALLRVVGNGP